MAGSDTSSKDAIGAVAAVIIFALALVGMCTICGGALFMIGWFTLT